MGNRSSDPKFAPSGPRADKYHWAIVLGGQTCSGKITFIKQMRVLFDRGFSDEEKANYKFVLISNILIPLKQIISKAKELNVEVGPEDACQMIEELDPYSLPDLTPARVKSIKSIWNNQGVQSIFVQRNEFFDYNGYDLPYCMSIIDKIADSEYTLSHEDIIKARQRTTGVAFNDVKIGKHWCGFDDASLTPKTSPLGNNVSGMIFMAPLDEWDVPSETDPKKTRLEASLELFVKYSKAQSYRELPLVLLLTKKDVFREKIKTTDLAKTFPEYKGGSDYEQAVAFIMGLYLAQLESSVRIQCHALCTLDAEEVRRVFDSIRAFIPEGSLKKFVVY